MSKSSDARSQSFIEEMRELSDLELTERKTVIHWKVGTIDGQLQDPANDDKDEQWRRNAKLALLYARRDLGLLNDLVHERRLSQGSTIAAMMTLQALVALYDVAKRFRTDDSDEAWAELEKELDRLDNLTIPVLL